jgi:hypothetical protein
MYAYIEFQIFLSPKYAFELFFKGTFRGTCINIACEEKPQHAKDTKTITTKSITKHTSELHSEP